MYNWGFKEAEEPEIKLPTFIGSWRKQGIQEKNIDLCSIDYAKASGLWIRTNWKILEEMGLPDHLTCLLRNLCVGQEATVVPIWNNWLVQNWERSMTRVFIVTLFIYLMCRVHHAEWWTGQITSWKQDWQQKHQQPLICRWYHSKGRKWGTKEPHFEGERGEWKS